METSRRLVGIYTRINSDPGDEKLGVQRQEEDAGKLCKARGWDVVEVFCDNDLSAFNPRKTRPAYQDMLDAVRLGKINTIVAWHPDRLHRQTRELVPFIDLINDHGVRIETVTAGPYDLRAVASLLASWGPWPSSNLSTSPRESSASSKRTRPRASTMEEAVHTVGTKMILGKASTAQ
jgi:hypothetical protein